MKRLLFIFISIAFVFLDYSCRESPADVVGGAVLISVIASVIEIGDLNKQYDAASPAEKQGIQNEIDNAEQWFRDASTAYAVIWLTDVLWVTYKGGRNKAKQRAGSGLTINYSENRLLAGYRLSF